MNKMSTNGQKFRFFLEQLRDEENIEAYDFSFVDDSTLHFKIEGLDKWLFGAWIQQPDDEDKKRNLDFHITVFCQYKRFIDKFKPSYSNYNIDIRGFNIYDVDSKDKSINYNLFELVKYINFMKKHEAMAFLYKNDITSYKGELYAKWIMFKMIFSDILFKWAKDRIYDSFHIISKLFSYFKCIDVIYCSDKINIYNKKHEHINDYWFIFTHNKVGEKAAAAMKWLNEKTTELGSIYITDDEETWLWDAYSIGEHEPIELKKIKKNDDGTIEVDYNELWAIVNQLECEDEIIVYGTV